MIFCVQMLRQPGTASQTLEHVAQTKTKKSASWAWQFGLSLLQNILQQYAVHSLDHISPVTNMSILNKCLIQVLFRAFFRMVFFHVLKSVRSISASGLFCFVLFCFVAIGAKLLLLHLLLVMLRTTKDKHVKSQTR